MASSDADGPAAARVDPLDPAQLPSDPLATWPHLRRVGVKRPFGDYVAELWRRREFVFTIPLGERRAQNQDTVLGNVWHLLNPLFLIGVYYLIFGVFLDVSDRGGVENFLAFLVVGVITFDYTRNSVNSGARMIVKNRALVRSINFPRVILPLSGLVSETMSHLYAVPLMWVLVLITGVRVTWHWLLIVPIVVLQAMFNLGIGMITARVTFHLRDVQQVLPYALRIWFYMSGVLFPITPALVSDDRLRFVLQLNPMYSFVEMSRDAFIVGTFDPVVWAMGAGWAVALLVIGFIYFRQAESEYGRV